MYNPVEVLDVCGIKLGPGQSPDEVIQKIFNDNFVQNKVFAYLVREHAVAALAPCLPIEKEALAKRCGVQPAPTKAPVVWEIIPAEASISGKLQIKITCGAETLFWNGGVQNLRTFRFRGELIPADIAAVYEMNYASGSDPAYAAAQRDYAALEQKKMDLERAGHGWRGAAARDPFIE